MFLSSLRLKAALVGTALVALPGASNAWWWPTEPQPAAYGDRGAHRAPLMGYPSPYPYSGRGGLPNDDVISQQANLLRQEVYRSRSATRMKIFDERRYYRENTPTFEQERQKSLSDRLSQATNNPPMPAILSGATLNDLATVIRQKETASGVRGPTVELSRDVVDAINWTTDANTPSVGLVRNGSKDVNWPSLLNSSHFEPKRQEVARLLDETVVAAGERSPKARQLAGRLQRELEAMREDLREMRFAADPQDYVDAVGQIRRLEDAATGLRNPGAFRVLNERIAANTVEGLVDQMTARGLKIGAAAPGNESYYTALYDAMAGYERGLNRMASGSTSSSRVSGGR
jgi:hypothetical protein